eukprot:2578433-Amphidinium_carterae.1
MGFQGWCAVSVSLPFLSDLGLPVAGSTVAPSVPMGFLDSPFMAVVWCLGGASIPAATASAAAWSE